MRLLLVFVVFLLAACAPKPDVNPVSAQGFEENEVETAVYVTSNGWHTGLVLPRAAIPLERIPEAADFPKAPFLEFGWGDAEFYPAQNPTVAMVLRAAFTPTAAVMHVVGLAAEPARVFPKAEVVRLQVDPDMLERLLDQIHGSFDRAEGRRAVATGPGLYPNSRFYPATGRFHLGNSCNSWTARALVAAGLPLEDAEITRAEGLMVQLRPLAAAQ